MQTILSMKPMLAVLASLLAVPLILATGDKRPNLREFWSILAGVIKFGMTQRKNYILSAIRTLLLLTNFINSL